MDTGTALPKLNSSVYVLPGDLHGNPAKYMLYVGQPVFLLPSQVAVDLPSAAITSSENDQARKQLPVPAHVSEEYFIEEMIEIQGEIQENKKEECEDDAVTVILDEYYYARKKPNLVFAEEINYKFQYQCSVCSKVLDNNIKVMKHMMTHMEDSQEKNIVFRDLIQCKYCFRGFETSFSMLCHIELVHMCSNELACLICNKGFSDSSNLVDHMKSTHVQSDMPYACQVCCYRSSFHREVLEHFQQVHNNHLQCHYCLKAIHIRLTAKFFEHMCKHKMKSAVKKCNACCLAFVNNFDLKNHKDKEHKGFHNQKGVTQMEHQSTKFIWVKDPHKKPVKDQHKKLVKHPRTEPRKIKLSSVVASTSKVRQSFTSERNLPSKTEHNLPSKIERNRPLKCCSVLVAEDVYSKLRCVECRKALEKEHFKRFFICSRCRYRTNCRAAFVEHFKCEHSKLAHLQASDIYLPQPMFCLCGISTSNGNNLAKHLVQCGKTFCFTSWDTSIVKIEPEDNFLENGSTSYAAPMEVVFEEEHGRSAIKM